MLSDFSFLDYVWKGLLVGTLLSTIVLVALFFVLCILRNRFSQTQIKWFLNQQMLLLLLTFIGSFVFMAFSDPELAIGCFKQFVNEASSFTITRFISGVWLCTVFLLLVFDSIKIYLSCLRVNRLRPVLDHKVRSALMKCLNKSRIKKNIRLLMATEKVSPYAWGIFSYNIVIPESSLKSLSIPTWENVFAHELIHLKEHDSLWLFLELLCRRFLFFNPLIYLARKKHLLAIEKSADEQAVKLVGMDSGKYVKSLIEVLEVCNGTNLNPIAVSVSQNFLEIKERIESLSQTHRSLGSSTNYYFIIVASFFLTTGLSVAQAQRAIKGFNERALVGMMCSQLRHEKIIESWLHIEPAPNKCEQ